jgi:hypothetical protein
MFKTFIKKLFFISLYFKASYKTPVFRKLADIGLIGCSAVVGLFRAINLREAA